MGFIEPKYKIPVPDNKKESDSEIETFNTKEEAVRFGKLASEIMVTIEKANYSYQETIRVIDAIKRNYERKGKDLLNDKSIKEVACYKALLD